MATPAYSVIIPALGALLVVIGAVVVKIGHWPRRRGSTLHCARCDYILTGAEERCPECGAVVGERAVVKGHRRRKPGLTAGGAAVALFGLTLLGLYVAALTGSVDWNRYKPLGWLLRDLDSPAASAPAWTEVRRRLDDNLLSEAQQGSLVEKALQAQAASGPAPFYLPHLLDFVGRRFLDHKLPDAQADRFFAGAMKLELAVRPLVGSLSSLPYAVRGAGRGPSGWWMRTKSIEAQVDDGPAQRQGGAVGGQFGGWSSTMTLPPVPSSGKHRLRVRVEMAVDPSANLIWNDNAPVVRRVEKDLLTDFEVTAGQTPIETQTTPDAGDLAKRLRPRVSFDPASHHLDVMLDTNSFPVDAAFDMRVRFNGRDYPFGGVSFHKNVASGYSTGRTDFEADPPAKIDILLRSSESVARETVDLTRIWKGEIVLKDVDVIRPATAPTK